MVDEHAKASCESKVSTALAVEIPWQGPRPQALFRVVCPSGWIYAGLSHLSLIVR